jgi:CheY-like chemotaxis protein
MPAKILVVDDEPDLELLIRQRFRRQIRDWALQFAFARHGVEALALLQADPEIDLVLTDINMVVGRSTPPWWRDSTATSASGSRRSGAGCTPSARVKRAGESS